MTTPTKVKAAILELTGKDLSNPDLIEAATLFCESFGSQWSVDANPYDPETEPTEHGNWPNNATLDHVAVFFSAKTRSFWQRQVYRAKKANESAANESSEAAAAQAAADKL